MPFSCAGSGARRRRLARSVVTGLLVGFWLVLARPVAVQGEEGARATGDSSALGPAELPATTQSYRIEAQLAPAARELRGRLLLRWRNPADHAIAAVPLHLYLNAFSHEQTTWMGGAIQGRWVDLDKLSRLHEQPWGWIEIERIVQRPADDEGDDGAPCSLRFIQPDDGNPLDRSLAEVGLPEPVAVAGELVLDISFVAHLPVPIARTGGVDDYFHVGHWFPKIGV